VRWVEHVARMGKTYYFRGLFGKPEWTIQFQITMCRWRIILKCVLTKRDWNKKDVLNIWSEHNSIYFDTDEYIQLHVSALYIGRHQVVL
jgi:hypothetical protein